ncbi:hypothetical protein SAMN05216251_102497 [Actinacidiphila alni]|uniref:DUF4388 domain-containing protein n=1 Tax=Actinacidiphila alni TaxID=380248 RepID=A0A1I1ZL09_9ACTN|nr:hypothetical protein [Actinacidiphila alni]SFE32514.1 hypothetical protein SAMN05216251_102497 [Actinacidiphila alni]
MTDGTGRREPRNVPSLLNALRQDGFTGAVEVTGGAGGTLFLRDGLVGAVETPAAPSARSLLLKSGRIGEPDWEAALAALAETGDLARSLTGRGLVSAAELHLVCTAALYDGAFAMALQPVTGWRTDAGRVPELAAWPGQEPARLAEETALRQRTLREHLPSVAEFARRPVPPVSAAGRAGLDRLGARTRTVLLRADGRRTPRDLAFALGRGVYPVLLDLARAAPGGAGRAAEQPVPAPLLTARAAEPYAPAGAPSGDRPLPRRVPGGSGGRPRGRTQIPNAGPPAPVSGTGTGLPEESAP